MKIIKQKKIEKIIFIIVNYNGSEDTLKCIDSIAEQNIESNVEIDLIIVDNASKPSDIHVIENYCKYYAWVKIIKSKENVGYFPGFNIAIDKYLTEFIKNNSHIVLCNNDLVFKRNFVHNYLSQNYSIDTYIISPNVITTDGRHQNPHALKKVSILRKLFYKLYYIDYSIAMTFEYISKIIKKPFENRIKKELSKQSQFILMGIGACYILPPKFFKQFQRLDDGVFLFGEEALLAEQIRKINGKTYYDQNLVVIHSDSATFKRVSTRWKYNEAKRSYDTYKDYL